MGIGGKGDKGEQLEYTKGQREISGSVVKGQGKEG